MRTASRVRPRSASARSWDLDAWLRTRLSAGQRTELDRARTRAAEAILLAPEPHPAVQRVLGVPGAEMGRRLAGALAPALERDS